MSEKAKSKGYWYERAANGEVLYCHKAKIHGRWIIVKKPVSDILKESRAA